MYYQTILANVISNITLVNLKIIKLYLINFLITKIIMCIVKVLENILVN